jgi:hypothetical protein
VVCLTTLVQAYILINIVYLECLETEGKVAFREVGFGIGKWMQLAQDRVSISDAEISGSPVTVLAEVL